MPDDRHQIALATCLDPQYAEPILSVMVGDSLDQAG
jgi:hypothetical protein